VLFSPHPGFFVLTLRRPRSGRLEARVGQPARSSPRNAEGVPNVSFLLGLVLFILGSALIALCLAAIPGPPGAAPAHPPHGHDAHGAHH
jgi:hypothetical protein